MKPCFRARLPSFAHSEFPQRVHAALVQRTQSERLVGHILRDATAIEVREKPGTQAQAGRPGGSPPASQGRTDQAPRADDPTERQCSGTMTLQEMLNELPRNCDNRLQARQQRKQVSLVRL